MRYNLISIFLLISLFSCGKTFQGPPGDKGIQGPAAKPCTVVQTVSGSKITCPDGTFALTYNGIDGTNGVNASCTVGSTSSGVSITCTDGSKAELINGTNGSIGTSCTVQQLTDGSKITCGDQIAYIYNGINAPISAFTFNKEIAPCGQASSPWKEQLLCMTNGNILASFSDNAAGLNTRLSNIPTGNYIDTDNSGCNFHIQVNSDNSTTVSWDAGSNQFATWVASSSICSNNQ